MTKRVLSFLLLICVCSSNIYGLRQQPERYRTFLFGADYYPEAWRESYWEQYAERMQECGVNVVRMGEFAWSVFEPQEGVYNFELFDKAIAILGKHGVKTILGTPTAAPPKWLTEKYPEVLYVFADGRIANDQSRRQVCLNSPIYRQFSRKIIEQFAAHYKDNPNIIGWQLDNEINEGSSECYSQSCRTAFRRWLQTKYKSLDALNERWGTRFWSQWYTSWAQPDLPLPTTGYHNPALKLDYKRFVSDSATSFIEEQISIIRHYRPRDFITHNGMFKNIDYYKFSRALDVYAQDNYPTFADMPQYSSGAGLTMIRSFTNRMMVMEELTGPAGQTYLLRTPQPGQMNLWTFQTIAHGADGVLHFRWRTARRGAEEYWFGVLDHDNVPRARFREFKKEGMEINKIGQEILGSQLLSDIAVIKDFDDEWVYDYQFFTPEVNVGSAYVYLFQAASEQKHNIDFISAGADFNRYKIIFAPYLIMVDEQLAAKLKEFVARGGTLIMSAHSAVKDRDNAMTEQTIPAMGLGELFGVEVDSYQCYQPPSRDKNAVRFADNTSIPVNVFADLLKPKTAQVIATWDRDYLKGAAACTENRSGNGKAVYYGSFFNLEAARYLVRRYATEQQLQPLLAGVNAQVEVTRRTKGKINYYFILNHANESVAVAPGAGFIDLLTGEPASSKFTLKPFEYRVLKRQ